MPDVAGSKRAVVSARESGRERPCGLNVTLKPTKDGIAKKTGVDSVAGAMSA